MEGKTYELRDRVRQAVRAEISAVAMRLFAEQGFHETTAEQIAREAGISVRSFFRYFATKEDVVLGNLAQGGERLRAALAARPGDETPWEALRAALGVLITDAGTNQELALTTMRLLLSAPSLRARHLEKQQRWQELLVPEIEGRLAAGQGAGPGPDPRATAIVASALACFDAATVAWALSGGQGSLGTLLDEAIAAVRSA
jgi:AcrR family transcriptional regulator